MEIRQAIQDHYGPQTAATYDQLAFDLFWGYDAVLEAISAEAIFGRKPRASVGVDSWRERYRVLDIGAGTGNLSFRLASDLERARTFRVQRRPFSQVDLTLFDGSEHMLKVAESKLRSISDIQVRTCKGQLEEVASLFQGQKFDLIVSSFAVHHLDPPGKRKLVFDLVSLLDTHGVLIIGDKMIPHHFETPEDYEYHLVMTSKFTRVVPEGEFVSHARILEQVVNQFDADHDQPSRLDDHVEWLKEAGLVDVRAPFQTFGSAIVSGVMPQSQ